MPDHCHLCGKPILDTENHFAVECVEVINSKDLGMTELKTVTTWHVRCIKKERYH